MQIVKITALAALLAGTFAPAPTFADPLERVLNSILLSQAGRYHRDDDDDDGRFRHRVHRYSHDDDDDDGRRRGSRGWHDDDDDGRRDRRGLRRDDDDD